LFPIFIMFITEFTQIAKLASQLRVFFFLV